MIGTGRELALLTSLLTLEADPQADHDALIAQILDDVACIEWPPIVGGLIGLVLALSERLTELQPEFDLMTIVRAVALDAESNPEFFNREGDAG